MKSTGLIMLLLSAVMAKKERVSDQQIEEITDKLFKVLEKRINTWDLDKNRDFEGTSEECAFGLNNGTIIRTHDSISAGATFIQSPTVLSMGDCQEECCEIANCNLAVYKDKDNDNSCYLFDCGSPSICEFTDHPGFISMAMPTRQTTNRQQAKHEEALEGLVTSSATSTTTTTTTQAPTTSTTTTISTTSTTTTTSMPDKIQPVPLFGECQSHKDCAGSSTECLAGYCVCQEGYHAQDGACRIDEDQTDDKHLSKSHELDQEDSPDGKGKDDENNESESNGAAVKNEDDLKNTVDIPSAPKDEKLPDKPPKETEPIKEKEEPKEKVVENKKSEDKPDESSSSDTNTGVEEPEGSEASKTLSDITDDDHQSVKTNDNQPKEESNDDNSLLPMAPAEKPEKPLSTSDEQDEEESDDSDVHVTYLTTTKNQGAVIALALGLVVTALLLIFVGCRLRNVKRRLRKGRPLNSNEADYLINGMYL